MVGTEKLNTAPDSCEAATTCPETSGGKNFDTTCTRNDRNRRADPKIKSDRCCASSVATMVSAPHMSVAIETRVDFLTWSTPMQKKAPLNKPSTAAMRSRTVARLMAPNV